MKKSLNLPEFLNELLFNKLSAKYEPNYSKFNKNLELNEEDVKIYLGTYFPRSYAESYLIFNDLFKNKIVKKFYNEKEEINILDIGAGSGGNLLGLLFALKDNFSNNLNINVFAIDGNQKALETLNKIVLKISIKYNIHINIKSQFITFNLINELYENSKEYLETNYDFIISSKMINEIIEKDSKAYYDFCKYFSKNLSKEGFLILIDVTMKVESKYLPIILNTQINEFIKNNNKLKTIIPTSCHLYENECNEQCFTNNLFYVSHKEKKNDLSKITYRILTHKNFADKILKNIQKGGLIGETQNSKKYCVYMENSKNINAYKVSL